MEETLFLIERAIDTAFTKDKYVLDLYSLLKSNNATGKEVRSFLESKSSENISELITELDEYLEKGKSDKTLGDAYGFLSKPRARKIKEYLEKMLEDAKRYEQEKKPGRKKGSKNKKKATVSK